MEALSSDAQQALQLPPLPDPATPGLPQGRVRAWTDGSCLHPADPLLARAGWGARLEGLPVGRLDSHGPVDGRRAAQRAELWAATHACSLAEAPMHVATDSRFVARRVVALRGGANPMNRQRAELWEAIAPLCRTGLLRVRWAKAHSTQAEAADRSISAEDWAGNDAAHSGWRLCEGPAHTAGLPPAAHAAAGGARGGPARGGRRGAGSPDGQPRPRQPRWAQSLAPLGGARPPPQTGAARGGCGSSRRRRSAAGSGTAWAASGCRAPRAPPRWADGRGEGVVCRRRLATACGGAGPGVGRLPEMRLLGAVLAAAREPAVRRPGSRVAAAGRHAAPASGGARWRPRRRVPRCPARSSAGAAGRP
ncbi:unnamed protein product [Prorocentrum cordatum]|uniref:RNase H type-1 domain-containing protein n=1 Tax=Prorocentrum cordatum TaxID=2364126 RepID=A0ABN9X7E0_9DINO|nr:unnamed protein product [Polarella glacialis]